MADTMSWERSLSQLRVTADEARPYNSEIATAIEAARAALSRNDLNAIAEAVLELAEYAQAHSVSVYDYEGAS